jgi:hypothetical protein
MDNPEKRATRPRKTKQKHNTMIKKHVIDILSLLLYILLT